MVKKHIYISIVLVCFCTGIFAAFTSLKLAFALVSAAAVLSVLLLDYQKATYAIALYAFLDFGVRQVIGSALLSSFWDELLFVLCVLLWVGKWFMDRRRKAYQWTPLEFPLIFFIGIGLFLLLANTEYMNIGIDGLRAVIQYMFWYFVVVQLLKSTAAVKRVYLILVFVGALLALHGVYQYIIGAEMPSNWVDAAEAGVRTRVYSIIGSPNILGSLMALLIPMSVSLIYYETKFLKKAIFGVIALIMTACLVFTFSRGAWVGFAVAIAVFLLMKDKRLLVPFIGLSLLVIVFVPEVGNRITYMLSPEYIASNMKGGRLLRWGKGLEMLKPVPWFGLGLGRFGGAVAMNNKLPGINYFYMDNYYLKTAVEMGVVGLSAFLFLMYNVVAWGLRAVKKLQHSSEVHLVQGMLAGMCGVLVHNFFENVFEVPMMTSYFWLLAGLIMFLGYTDRGKAIEDI